MNTYRLTLRNGHAFTLASPNDIKAITEKLTVTPSTVTTAPFWVFDDATAVYAADIVAIELIPVTNEAPEGVWPPDDRCKDESEICPFCPHLAANHTIDGCEDCDCNTFLESWIGSRVES